VAYREKFVEVTIDAEPDQTRDRGSSLAIALNFSGVPASKHGVSAVQQRTKPSGRILLHRRQDVRVNSKGHLNAFVPEARLNDLHWHSSLKHQRRASVPHPLAFDSSHIRCF
jgi:hypothetical protein